MSLQMVWRRNRFKKRLVYVAVLSVQGIKEPCTKYIHMVEEGATRKRKWPVTLSESFRQPFMQ
jgi:hypothetical protein